MHRRIIHLAVAFLGAFLNSYAEEPGNVRIIPSGFAAYHFGQLQHVTPSQNEFAGRVEQYFSGRLTLKAIIDERLQIIVGAEGKLTASLNDNAQKKDVLLKEAQGIYSFGDPENSHLQLAAGYFPFKYNPQARNLGEYMFRTGTYPGFIITDFDNAKARLMGFRATNSSIEGLDLNALFTSEYTVHPYFDYSISLIGGYRVFDGIFDVGLGMIWERIFPVHEKRTTDPLNVVYDKANNPVIEDGDTLKFTFKGTKLMGRLTFDPKPLLPFRELLGPEDGKIYGEIAALGLKNYGATYPSLKKRIPMMWGVNIPCFKVLDVLAYEMEYYPSDSTTKLDIPTSGKPIPDLYSGTKRTFWKWSLYAKKTVTKGFELITLFGRDHYRDLDPGGNYDPIERMNGPKDWHYNLKGQFSF